MLDGNYVHMAEINIIRGTNVIIFHVLSDLKLDRVAIGDFVV